MRLAEVAKVAEARAVMTTMTSTTPAAAPAQGYAPVYFPGTTTPSMAARVALGVSEEKTAIDIRLQVVPFSTINGFVSGASPMPAGLTVYLAETGPVIAMGARTSRVDADGRFSFSAVPPGQYQLFARTPLRPAVASVPAAAGVAFSRSRTNTMALGTIRSDDCRSAACRCLDDAGAGNHGVRIGRVSRIRRTAADPARMRLVFAALSSLTGRRGDGVRHQPRGASTTRDDLPGRIDAGRYRVTASGAGSWILSSVSVQGREALDFPLEVRSGEDIGGVTVTFTDRSTTLDGLLQDAGGQPAASYTVVVFADDNRYRTPMSRRIQATRPATDGRFSFKNLPPGEYRLAAVIDPEPGQWFDPRVLAPTRRRIHTRSTCRRRDEVSGLTSRTVRDTTCNSRTHKLVL